MFGTVPPMGVHFNPMPVDATGPNFEWRTFPARNSKKWRDRTRAYLWLGKHYIVNFYTRW